MIIRVPFKYGKLIIERDVDFVFKITTLEIATLEILGIDLNQISTKSADEVNVAILYAGYITSCKDRYKKPKYKEIDAAFWSSHMNKESIELFHKYLTELMGSLKSISTSEDKKKANQDGKNSEVLQSEN
jgi:hypothetical protein